jgi:3-hydroxybutyryl-CoA dehydrogenase
MEIIVLADDKQKAELLSKNKKENVTIEFVNNSVQLFSYAGADALFILHNEISINELQSFTNSPVFVQSVISTLNDLRLPQNVSRLNAWPTFLKRELWEIATKDEAKVQNVFEALGWEYLVVPDEPGFIAARIIAMIINEAYFAFEDGVSSKEEIDVAMQLGTNYPYGPFEWSQKIGLRNIYSLLKRLHKESNRYSVSPAMENELNKMR